MRIFIGEVYWCGKVNFVDDNNVLLGYSNDDECCAKGGWFISDKADEWDEHSFEEKEMELPGYVFDVTYIKEWPLTEQNEYDGGRPLQFRLVNGEKEKFLTIYNHHNGYYGRGFEFKYGNKIIKEGCI